MHGGGEAASASQQSPRAGVLSVVSDFCTSPSGLAPGSLSIVLGTQAKPNESVLAETVKSRIIRRVYLQIMTWIVKRVDIYLQKRNILYSIQ